ncbi:MAG: hypothetical protein ACK46Q_08615 [Hyphomonas sp.]
MTRTPRPRKTPAKQPKTVRLEFDFAGIKSGSLMFVATPDILAAYIRQIPYGETRTIIAMRREIARRRRCDAMCPVSTAIFLRQIAEAALRELAEGQPVSDVTPFWRLISSGDKIAKRLPVDPSWIDTQRAIEAQSPQTEPPS